MHTVDDDFHDVFIELLFNMGSGMVYHIFAEVTESLDIDDIVLRKKYTIIIEDDLNNYEPYYDEDYDTDDDEGTADDEVFQPSIDTWVDVVIPLPL